MPLSFTPGYNNRFKQLYKYGVYQNNVTCNCIQPQTYVVKTGSNDPTQTENNRITRAVTNNLGGKIMWGNFGVPAKVNYLGGIEGQPGGSLRPLRNRF